MNPSQVKEQAKHDPEAQAILHKIFDENMLPQDAIGFTKEMMEAMYSQAHSLYSAGRYQQASEIFRLLITLNPTVFKYTFGLAATQQMMKEYITAVITYQLCALMELNNPLPHYYSSDCFLKLKDKAGAINALETAIKVAGDSKEYQMLSDRCKMTLASLKE
jgi:type III secretion system low calcium response chaperone LcrH/SycD